MKRIISILLALALALIAPVLLAVPVSASINEIFFYNDYELPALPEYDTTQYTYAVIGYHASSIYLSVFSKEVVYNTGLDRAEYTALNTNYIRWKFSSEEFAWVYMTSGTNNSSSGSINPKEPFWCNFDLMTRDEGSLWLGASVPVAAGVPVVPVYDTSFEGQTISVPYGDPVKFYMLAGEVNGTLSCEWYVNDYLFDEVFDFAYIEGSNWPYVQAWKYEPSSAGVYTLYAVLKNTLGDSSASITTGKVMVYYGVSPGGDSSGSGDNSEVLGSLETIDTTLAEVQDAVSSTNDKIDNVSQQVEQLPDQIVDGMGELMDQEKAEAESTGQSSADEVLEMIPDESQGFLDALSSLLDVLTYDGTEAVLVFPAITIPGIDGLFPEFTVLGEQRINFEEYVALLPEKWYDLSVALFDIALVLYCVKEFYGTIGGFFHGFVGKE